jgi:hypothetical protein
MPLDAEERERLIGVAQSYADGAATEVRLTIESAGPNVLVRGVRVQADGRDQIETLSLAWELVERSGVPEHFLHTQIWAVEQTLTPAATIGRPRP